MGNRCPKVRGGGFDGLGGEVPHQVFDVLDEQQHEDVVLVLARVVGDAERCCSRRDGAREEPSLG
jgi:hypothetical protein